MGTAIMKLPLFPTDWHSAAPQFVAEEKDYTLQFVVSSLSAETHNFHM